tara:strand:+ start:815 stop:1021 length:207 start_codon:yes stop_codon:yes gene_type:complete
MSFTDYEMIVLAIGLVGVYVKLHAELTKLTSRVYSLENGNKKIERSLERVEHDLAEIKLLLARKQMDK